MGDQPSTCRRCGDDLRNEHDEWTHISVTRWEQDAADFAISLCVDCADEVVPDLAEWAEDHWFEEDDDGDE